MMEYIIGFIVGVLVMFLVWFLSNFILKTSIDNHLKKGEALNKEGDALIEKKEQIQRELAELMVKHKILE